VSTAAAPTRVLHVIEPGSSLACSGSDAACLWLLTLIAQTPGLCHDVLVLGTQRDEEHLLALGIDTTDRITPLRGDPVLASRALERFIACRGGADATLAWTTRAGDALRAARAPNLRLASLAVAAGPGAGVKREESARESDPLPAGAKGETPSRSPEAQATEQGDIGRMTGPDEMPAPPSEADAHARSGVWPLPPRVHGRDDLRRALEIEDHEVVIAFISDRPEHTDPRVLIWAIDMLRLIGVPATALASSRAPAMTPARRMMPMARMGVGLIEVDGPTTPFMPACDILIAVGASRRMPGAPEVTAPAALLARAALVQGSPVLALESVARLAPSALTLEAMTPSAIVDQIVPLWRGGFRPGDRPARAAPKACPGAFDLPGPRLGESARAGPVGAPAGGPGR
jgi:hypothetical protein